MDLPEFSTHSFIVRMWLEEMGDADKQAQWRGHVTHVPSNTRRHFKNLNEIIAFIKLYINGIETDTEVHEEGR